VFRQPNLGRRTVECSGLQERRSRAPARTRRFSGGSARWPLPTRAASYTRALLVAQRATLSQWWFGYLIQAFRHKGLRLFFETGKTRDGHVFDLDFEDYH